MRRNDSRRPHRRSRTSKNRAFPGQRSAPSPGQWTIERARPDTHAPVFCPHFGPCGGCQYLDLRYEVEIERKVSAFVDHLRTLPRLRHASVLPPLAAKDPLFYRTALKIPFGTSHRGTTCGFYRPGSHSIVDLEVCAIQHPLLTEMIVVARRLANELSLPIYQEYKHHGLLRHLLARVAPGTGRSLIGIVVRKGHAPPIQRFARALYDEFSGEGLVGVVENINAERTNVIVGDRSRRLVGESVLEEEQDGLRFRSSITSFVQVNSAQASELFAEVVRQLGDVGDRHVCDLFSGSGPIALRVAKAGARVTAIERNPDAAKDGVAAARENGLEDRVRFFAADAFAGLHRLDADGLDAVIVDPPRRGLTEELIDLFSELRFKKLIYVSCNPETHVRDLLMLAPAFDVEVIRPVDLFPRTAHLEVVTSLRRK